MNAKMTLKTKTKPNEDPVYMTEDQGPFRCDNCDHYVKVTSTCIKPEMVKKYNPKGVAIKVQAGACCNYFEHKR